MFLSDHIHQSLPHRHRLAPNFVSSLLQGTSEEKCGSRCIFWLRERTVLGGNLLQAIVLWPGNGNVRAREDIFAVLGGRSDHRITAQALHDAWAAITHKVGPEWHEVVSLGSNRRAKSTAETNEAEMLQHGLR